MDEKVILELLVDKTMADDIYKKGLAEIALRRMDAKFKAMVKCKVMGELSSKATVPENVHPYALQKNFKVENIRGMLQAIGQKNEIIGSNLKNLSVNVDSIYRTSQAIQSISFLNTGLELANLAVSIAGFVIIGKKLNNLYSEVEKASEGIENLQKNEWNKMIRDCRKLILDYVDLSDKLSKNKLVTLDDLFKWLGDAIPFLSYLYANFKDHVIPENLFYHMYFVLLPAYGQILYNYITKYYYENGTLPPTYEMCMNIYENSLSDEFQKRIQDYYFIEQKLCYADALDAMETSMLLTCNGKTLIEDQIQVLQAFKTKELVDAFDKEIDNVVLNRKLQM